jgi:hypothetical protein
LIVGAQEIASGGLSLEDFFVCFAFWFILRSSFLLHCSYAPQILPSVIFFFPLFLPLSFIW